MFATIMKSNTSVGIRSTVIVPVNDTVRVFSRIGESRGVAGAWKEEEPTFELGEVLVGKPSSIIITPSDYSILAYPVTPTVLLQKLGRTVKGVYSVTVNDAASLYDTLVETASTNPSALAVYGYAMQAVTQAVAPQPVVTQPVATPQASTPMPEPTNVEEESPMEYMAVDKTVDAVLTIPAKEAYFPRKFDGLTEEQVYDYARSTQQNVLLTGDAGTGKTSSARNYAASRNLPFVIIECTQQIDQSVTQGRYVPTGRGNEAVWKDSQLVTIIQQPGVVLINEMTRMSPKAAVLFLRLLEERELIVEATNRVIKVHPDCIFIADQNTGFGYTGTSKQDAALVDRFNIKLEFHYDTKIESNFIKSPALLTFASAIREASEMNDEFSVPMSTRILKNFVAQAVGLNFKFAVASLLSNYPKSDGEREAIKMRFDANVDTICAELGITKGDYSTK
jgi:MoxR-like ATPase